MNKACLFLKMSFVLLFTLSSSLPMLYGQNSFHYAGGHFSFNLPSGWERLPNYVLDEYAEKVMKEFGVKLKHDLAFNRTTATWPFEYPYFTITVHGQKMNDSTIQKYISSIEAETQQTFRKQELKNVYFDALTASPIYDESKRIITYFSSSKIIYDSGKETYLITFVALFFFKEGVVSFEFYCPRTTFAYHLPTIRGIINSFTFGEAFEYMSTPGGDMLFRFAKGAGIGLLLFLIYLGKKRKWLCGKRN
jgi:hypothetical protein